MLRRSRPRLRGLRRAVAALAGQALLAGTLVMATAGAAAAAPAVSSAVDAGNGFPLWYQDNGGTRVEQCLDPNDPNCVVLAGPTFDPLQPTVFPTNFPDEFFYALADSDNIATPGCNGTLPGRASVRLAVEGAFVNGNPAPNEQMVFGRIRVVVTSGLCPNTTYTFSHPFGSEVLTTNAAGGIPRNQSTEDVGCAPVPPATCDFALAERSRVFGAPTGGFLRWDPNVTPAAPAGYLGDAVTLHKISGGTNPDGNAFTISGPGATGLTTDLYTVAGKIAGPLQASPRPLDFGGQDVGTTSAERTVTVTNLWDTPVSVTSATLPAGTSYSISSNTCTGVTLARDATCTVGLRFAPTATSPAGRQDTTLSVAYTGAPRSPLAEPVTGHANPVGSAPVVSLSPTSIDFGAVRVRTLSASKTVTVSNTGTATLSMKTAAIDPATQPESDHYRISRDTCSGRSVDPGGSCAVGVQFVPTIAGAHPSALLLTSNEQTSPHRVPLAGTGTGGIAAVSPTIAASDGYPDWYRDEADVKLAQCIDPKDPNCVVLADDFFDPAKPLVFPTNFPSEFFYHVVDSDLIPTSGCQGTLPGRVFIRSAVEGAFSGLGPVPGEQIVFGRIRIVASGLCPNTEYVFTHPYGQDHLTTNSTGSIARNAGTEDIGCFPVAPDTCDFSLALSSRVFGGFLRWDPAVAPAAPAGYLGDAATLHKVVGSPFTAPGDATPANYFQVADTRGSVVGRTNLFTVMGKLQGPLESTPSSVDAGTVPVGSVSSPQTVTFTNTGLSPHTITAAGGTLSGVDAADFAVSADTCAGATLAAATATAPGGTCTVSVTFSPSATGTRSATLTLLHDGLNSPLNVPLSGTGGAGANTAAISFAPRSLTFAPLHVGRRSPTQHLVVSNAGGQADLVISSVALGGTTPSAYAITGNSCTTPVPPGGSCTVDVVFAPQAAGTANATVNFVDNAPAPGSQHSVAVTGSGSAATPAVSTALDSRNGYPQWYQDSNGARLEPCLDPADTGCVVLADAGFDPGQPVAFPDNFPSEFFYALADSDLIPTPGCGGTSPGNASMRAALEGSFAGGTPTAGDQTTFGRVRIIVRSGLCPNVPYTFVTPFGPVTYTTNSAGGLALNVSTQDIGCGAAPCAFSDALASPVADSFLRWDPASSPAAPADHLGDALTLHKVVGGTYVQPGTSEPVNFFRIQDSAGNDLGTTDQFFVSGKLAGPLAPDTFAVDFGNQSTASTSGARTVTITDIGAASVGISSVAIGGVNAGDFALADPPGTCSGATLTLDTSCTVRVVFKPTADGARSATLRVTPSSGPAVTVQLTGTGTTPTAPVASVSPGILAYGTVVAGSSATLSTTVSNTGNANLVVGTPTVSGTAAADYSVTGNTCTVAVAPGGSCRIAVTFRPTAAGSRTASLTIPHNAATGSTVVSLTGNGAASSFTLSPTTVNFGGITRGTSKTSTVTVKNSSTLSFTVTALAITGTQASSFSATGCVGTVLAPGRTCNVTVTFRPAVTGNFSATLAVSGDATTLPKTVKATLTGQGK